MIEMRWIWKVVSEDFDGGAPTMERVLQYRVAEQKYTTGGVVGLPYQDWTGWTDVQEVEGE